jgi:hypothetical protein
MRSIIDTYFGPNRTVADPRELGEPVRPFTLVIARCYTSFGWAGGRIDCTDSSGRGEDGLSGPYVGDGVFQFGFGDGRMTNLLWSGL